ncbi:MAG: CoA transferase, partial [Solirubrobacteraceae bacterium]|nr:CoA transferase [Solirubrobacteraceae bacterium]
LVAGTDVVINGLRPGALDGLGLYPERRAALAPGLIDASLSAYGPGPWHGRRGFDSLVQLSTGLGMAEASAADPGALLPRALPCQILDHATGLLLAAAIIRAATARLADGRGRTLIASLARTAAELAGAGRVPFDGTAPQPARTGAFVLTGPHGTTSHAPLPVSIAGVNGGWRTGPPLVGQDAPSWR